MREHFILFDVRPYIMLLKRHHQLNSQPTKYSQPLMFCLCLMALANPVSLLTALCVCDSSTVGRMWRAGRWGLALGDPGQLCHAVIVPSLSVGSQSAHHSGDDHHGDRLSGLCGSCQRKPSSAADGKSFAKLASDDCWLGTEGWIRFYILRL